MAVIGVVGSGLMGSGIAQVSAVAGHDVVLHDLDAQSLARGLAAIDSSLAKLVGKGRIDAQAASAARDRLTTTTEMDALAPAALIVEAVYEDLDVKREIFRRLDALAGADTVLATNTSALPITAIAAATGRPDRVVGTHFFSPVPLMRLCELVRGLHTSDETLARARTFAEEIGKTVIVVERDVAGFVTTRLIAALSVEALRLWEAGIATPEDIDTACRLGFGHPMGPFETADLTGLDILMHATDNIYEQTRTDTFVVPEGLRRMVVGGRLGRKTGQGFYSYE